MGAFDKIARSIELQVRFDFRRREKDVARLITANLVLLVIEFFKMVLFDDKEHIINVAFPNFRRS